MAGIEWEADHRYEPVNGRLRDFCTARDVAMPHKFMAGQPVVFLASEALAAIDQHLAADLNQEQGGVLIGCPYHDPDLGQHFVDVRAVAPALGAEGSAVHLQFTAEAWSYMSALIEAEFPDQVIVGWYHSHPGLGVFMSGTDRASQRAFYRHPWSLALVVDPRSSEQGWFSGPECHRLGPGMTIVYDSRRRPADSADGLVEADSVPIERSPAKVADMVWLMPIMLLGTALAVQLWYLGQRRRGTRQ
jgi:proteasome lid subunit RPN8/RPN11